MAASAAAAIPVDASGVVPRMAINAAPVAAARPGNGVVITGTRRAPESRWLRTGIAAPPPTRAIAVTSAARL